MNRFKWVNMQHTNNFYRGCKNRNMLISKGRQSQSGCKLSSHLWQKRFWRPFCIYTLTVCEDSLCNTSAPSATSSGWSFYFLCSFFNTDCVRNLQGSLKLFMTYLMFQAFMPIDLCLAKWWTLIENKNSNGNGPGMCFLVYETILANTVNISPFFISQHQTVVSLLWNVAKLNLFLSFNDQKIVINVSLPLSPGLLQFTVSLYMRMSQSSLSGLQQVHNAAAGLLNWTRTRDSILYLHLYIGSQLSLGLGLRLCYLFSVTLSCTSVELWAPLPSFQLQIS